MRLLGGLDWWRYGVDRLSRAGARARHRARGAARRGPRRSAARANASTLPPDELAALLALSSAKAAATICARCCAGSRGHAGRAARLRRAASRCRAWPAICRATARSSLDALVGGAAAGAAGRADHLLSLDAARGRHRADRCAVRGACGARARAGAAGRHRASRTRRRRRSCAARCSGSRPSVIVTTTAFAAGGRRANRSPLDGAGVPVLQAVIATTKRAAWRDSPRGLGAADLAMHVVLPELDGRVLAGAIAFKDALPPHDGLAFTALRQPAGAGPHRLGGRSHRGARRGCRRRRAPSGGSRC